MEELGKIVVVAPDTPQNGMSHAITINNTLYLNKTSKENDSFLEYSFSCTPIDCVKLAVNEILKRKPDLCVSGVNHSSNSSINVIYSGTMSATAEAGIEGIPAIGFLFLDFDWNATFEPIKPYIRKITLEVLESGLPEEVILNVNFPKLEKKRSKESGFVVKQKHVGWRNLIKEKHLKEEIIFGLPENL